MKAQFFLPLVTYPDFNSDAVAANAVAVAVRMNADLTAMAINASIRHVSSALSRLLLDLPKMTREAEALSRDRGKHLLAAVTEEARRRNVLVATSAVTDSLPLLCDTAGEQARYFDLSLVGWEVGNPTSRATAEAIVFGSGRPTLLLPEAVPVGRLDRIAIAWDGTRVAARAVADALPFLQHASKIHVLTVVDEKPLEKDVGERLVAGLRKRGLACEAISVTARDTAVGIALQERAAAVGADLLVMGGYGHSRLRDFVLGGATEGVLDDLRLPILLSH